MFGSNVEYLSWTDPFSGHHPDPPPPAGSGATPVPTPTPARPPLTTPPVPHQAPLREAAWRTTPGWEAPPAPWDPSCCPATRSWTSPLKPGGHREPSSASWPVKETPAWRLFRIPLERRDVSRTAWPSSFFRCPPTSAGTNPNLETLLCSGPLFLLLNVLRLWNESGSFYTVNEVNKTLHRE